MNVGALKDNIYFLLFTTVALVGDTAFNPGTVARCF
jgi:hypothetical protein